MLMAEILACLLCSSLIASSGTLVLLILRSLITLRAGPSVTVGVPLRAACSVSATAMSAQS